MADGTPSADARRAGWDLFLISFLALFAEVAFIRWLSSETRVFGFYKNFALISCFLGLGAGATLGSQSRSGRWFLPALALFGVFVSLSAPRLTHLSPPSGDEYIWVPSTQGLEQLNFFLALLIFFALNCAVFFLGGQRVGAAFERLPPLQAYSINLLGSLLGTLAFTAVSYLHLGPLAWFLVIAAVGLVQVWRDPLVRNLSLASGALLVAFLGPFGQSAIWSPYYKITASPRLAPDGAKWGWRFDTNATYHLSALDLSQAFRDAHPSLADTSPPGYYDLPYRYRKADRVLVLGAGAGNDVAAALRAGAKEVVAVEIDPAIVELGRALHPEKPYSDPRVTVVVDDARAYLSRTSSKFGLIVYGLLDSHTVVAAMSNVRLDNFMYTRESFERAKALLDEGGLIALSFSSGFGESWWVLQRIHHMLALTFGKPPLALDADYDRGFVFLAGEQPPAKGADEDDDFRIERATKQLASVDQQPSDLTLSDDWPFMYLKRRVVPSEYWVMGLVVLALSVLLVRRLTPGGLKAIDPRFFFLGAGFLLVEVRNLAELALLFGSTWVVNAFVISGVLLMALIANTVAQRFTVPLHVAFGLLAVAVAASFFSPAQYLTGAPPVLKAIAGTALLSLPFAFSGLVFSATFKGVASPSAAYGSNLLGALAGGMLEHASLALGIRALSALALVLYAAAFVFVLKGQRAATGVGAPVR